MNTFATSWSHVRAQINRKNSLLIQPVHHLQQNRSNTSQKQFDTFESVDVVADSSHACVCLLSLVIMGVEDQGEADDRASVSWQVQTAGGPVLPSVHAGQPGECAEQITGRQRGKVRARD